MATYKPILHHRQRKDGTKRIMIRIIKHRKPVYVGTEIYIEEKHWNSRKAEVKASNSLYHVYNLSIQKQINAYQEAEVKAQITGNPLTAIQIKTQNQKESEDLIAYFESQIEYAKKHLSESTAINYEIALKKLTDFTEGKKLLFADLNSKWLQDYYNYIIEKNAKSSANNYIAILSTIIAKAIKEEATSLVKHPFATFKKSKETSDKDRLSLEEIQILKELQLPDKYAKVKDLVLFSFFAAGMRIKDALTLTKEHLQGDRIVYTMSKTKKKRSILLSPAMVEIIERASNPNTNYLFDFIKTTPPDHHETRNKIVYINRFLKVIAEKAGINKKISTHTARHSFANIARLQTKDIYAISKALGHSDIKITQNYLGSLDMGENDEFIKSVTG